MDVFDRDWCNLFVWTVNGSTLFHIKRDPEYWRLCFQGLADFWWSHVIPAKHELAANGMGTEERYRYPPRLEKKRKDYAVRRDSREAHV